MAALAEPPPVAATEPEDDEFASLGGAPAPYRWLTAELPNPARPAVGRQYDGVRETCEQWDAEGAGTPQRRAYDELRARDPEFTASWETFCAIAWGMARHPDGRILTRAELRERNARIDAQASWRRAGGTPLPERPPLPERAPEPEPERKTMLIGGIRMDPDEVQAARREIAERNKQREQLRKQGRDPDVEDRRAQLERERRKREAAEKRRATMERKRRERERVAEFQQRVEDERRREVERRASEVTPIAGPARTRIRRTPGGPPAKLTRAAIDRARVLYYDELYTFATIARRLIAEGLVADTTNPDTVYNRLRTLWRRQRWPKRSWKDAVRLRDARHGALYRGRICKGLTTGTGLAPAGKPCEQNALDDSEYCWLHDPRPEYVAKREQALQRLHLGKAKFPTAPLEPFRVWADKRRQVLLEQARIQGPVHPNNQGWRFLARELGVDQAQLKRWIDGQGTHGPTEVIRVDTVVRLLEKGGATFRAVYGFDPPPPGPENPAYRCACGNPKDHESKTCRECYDRARGQQCTYRGRGGRRCPITTNDPSGKCYKHRTQERRRTGQRHIRPTPLTPAMLRAALVEYVDVPRLGWVARHMLAEDLAGAASVYSKSKSLESALRRAFAQRGWTDPDTAAAALEADDPASFVIPNSKG